MQYHWFTGIRRYPRQRETGFFSRLAAIAAKRLIEPAKFRLPDGTRV
jgi:hypothetical protein